MRTSPIGRATPGQRWSAQAGCDYQNRVERHRGNPEETMRIEAGQRVTRALVQRHRHAERETADHEKQPDAP